ncbi:uncharacterized protein BJ212DRAFT_1377895 [Suillus subaureus]|uniref:Uncharacterized protein n=1 Tax=Suillus subaureus TaxID=48587 RepID=A0A9P7E4P9_9AGAM|nr:uncharacterized protein BJ212DRAFT_1377895 [Suillus subaureus]KAG1810646.1 hypothetical protein BJ212DRAFT_1377895 [Suillus subaureus]
MSSIETRWGPVEDNCTFCVSFPRTLKHEIASTVITDERARAATLSYLCVRSRRDDPGRRSNCFA